MRGKQKLVKCDEKENFRMCTSMRKHYRIPIHYEYYDEIVFGGSLSTQTSFLYR